MYSKCFCSIDIELLRLDRVSGFDLSIKVPSMKELDGVCIEDRTYSLLL